MLNMPTTTRQTTRTPIYFSLIKSTNVSVLLFLHFICLTFEEQLVIIFLLHGATIDEPVAIIVLVKTAQCHLFGQSWLIVKCLPKNEQTVFFLITFPGY